MLAIISVVHLPSSRATALHDRWNGKAGVFRL